MIDKRLIKFLGSDIKYVFVSDFAMIIGFLSNILFTACICKIIQLILENKPFEEYYLFFGLMLAAAGIRFVTTILSGKYKDKVGRNVKRAFRKRIYDKITSLGLRSADGINIAGLTQVSIEGVEQLDLYFSSYIPQFFFAMICPVILFAVCVGISWQFALTLILCVPLIPMSIVAVSRYAKKVFAKYWGEYTSMGDAFLDSVQGLKELKIFKADEAQHKRMNEKSERFRKITMKVLVMQLASSTIMDLVAYGGAGCGIAIAVSSANKGLPIAKSLFLILMAVEFFLPLRRFGSAFHIAMNGISAGKKILDMLELPDPEWGNEKPESCDIEIKNISFGYNDEKKVLEGVSLTLPAEGMTAIVGKSGCGKSTIVNLISGANRCDSGEILIGGKRLRELDRAAYYSLISVVSYNTYIFNISVRDNFRLANPDISEEKIMSCLKKVNLCDFVVNNGGLDRIITEDAANISGGQKQRLALAINIAADKKIYIFDEATSNIDTESEAIIMNNIKLLSKEKNVIVISHRLENVVDADKIIYLENGRVAEQGNHDELLKNNKGYADLYKTQRNLENGYKAVMA